MDAQKCLEKLRYVGGLSFATVDQYGKPQIRNSNFPHLKRDPHIEKSIL